MKKLLGIMGLMLCVSLHAQTYDTNGVVVQTFAGSGFSGWVDGQGVQTMFNKPDSLVADTSGNLFVLDRVNYRVRKIDTNGMVSSFAGGGTGTLPGFGTNVSLKIHAGTVGRMAIDRRNVLWVGANSGGGPGAYLLKIETNGYVSVVASDLTDYSSFSGLCFDSQNRLYYTGGNKIYRYITNDLSEVFAGSGNQGSEDGNGIFSSFFLPLALASDAADNIYAWDSGYYLLRKINQNRDVVTIAGKKNFYTSGQDGTGTNASFRTIQSMSADDFGNMLLACGPTVRKIDTAANVTTLAGSFTEYAYMNGAGTSARFRNASGLCIVSGRIFVSDSDDHRIRQISFDPVEQPVSGGNLELETFPGLRLTGTVGRSYRVESSLNFSTWNTETTLLLTSSPYLWIDQNSLGQKKFYRAFMLP